MDELALTKTVTKKQYIQLWTCSGSASASCLMEGLHLLYPLRMTEGHVRDKLMKRSTMEERSACSWGTPWIVTVDDANDRHGWCEEDKSEQET